jgi:hypothetical protein
MRGKHSRRKLDKSLPSQADTGYDDAVADQRPHCPQPEPIMEEGQLVVVLLMALLLGSLLVMAVQRRPGQDVQPEEQPSLQVEQAPPVEDEPVEPEPVAQEPVEQAQEPEPEPEPAPVKDIGYGRMLGRIRVWKATVEAPVR